MNSYYEAVYHINLCDGDYTPLLKFCIEAAVNLMVSFPDIESGEDNKYVPFDEKTLTEPSGVTEQRLFFGNSSSGIEVRVRDEFSGEGILLSSAVSAETFGLSGRERVVVKSTREEWEPCCNRIVELNLYAPEIKGKVVAEMFRDYFKESDPGEGSADLIKRALEVKIRKKLWESVSEDAVYLLKYHPEDPELLMALGMASGAAGDWRGARRSLLKAVEKLNGRSEAWHHLGLAYRSGRDNGSALRCFEKALELDPLSHESYYMKGVILKETGREDEAVESLRYAIKYSPEHSDCGDERPADLCSEAKEALSDLGFPWNGSAELRDPYGVDLNEDLVRAASEGDVRKLAKLLLKKCDPDHISTDIQMHGRTALIAAVIEGHHNAARYLLDHGASVEMRDSSGCTPLASAVEWSGSYDMIRILVEYGADVNGRDPYGRPLVLNERVLDDVKILSLLINAGADPYAADEDGANGVYCAAAAGRSEAVQFFIEHGADTNCRIKSGATPLNAAVNKGGHEILRFLLDKGCAPDVPDNEGRTPLMIAAENSDPDSIALLIQAGADVNKRDNMGRSALEIILESGRKENMEAYRKCVELLTEAGAELLRNPGL